MAGCCFLFCRSRADDYVDAQTLPSVKVRHGQWQDTQVGSSRIIGVAAGFPKSNSMSGSASASKHGITSASLLDLANQMSPKLSAAWINDAIWLAENPSTRIDCDVVPDIGQDYAIVAAHEEAERRRLSDIAFYMDHNSSHSTNLVGQLSTASSFNCTQPCYSPSTLSSIQLHSLGGRPSPDLHTIHEQGKPDNHSGDSNKEDGSKPADTPASSRPEHSSASPAMRRAAPYSPLAPNGVHQSLPRSQSTQPNKRLSAASAADLTSEDACYGPSASALAFNRRSTGTGYSIRYNAQDVHTSHSSNGSRLPGSWQSSAMSSFNTPSAADIARQYGCTSTTPSRQSRLNSGSGGGASQATSGPLPISASGSIQQAEPLKQLAGSPPETSRGFLRRFTTSSSRGASRASGNIKRASSGNCNAAASLTYDSMGRSPKVRSVGQSDGGIDQGNMPPRYFDQDLYINIMHMLTQQGAIRNTSSAGGEHAEEGQQAEQQPLAEQELHVEEEQPSRELNDA